MQKPHSMRTKKEIEKTVEKIFSLGVFGRDLVEYLDTKLFLTGLLQYMNIETFEKDTPICDYGNLCPKVLKL